MERLAHAPHAPVAIESDPPRVVTHGHADRPAPPPDGVRAILSDFFDTLVFRRIAPEDVKRLWAYRLSNLLDLPQGGERLYQFRSRTEVQLCHANRQGGHDEEFDVLRCYEELWRHGYGSHLELERFRTLAADLELSIECSVQTVDETVAEYLRHWHDRGMRLYLVSDFYFPGTLFRRLLAHHGLDDLFDDVKVSADDLLTKRSGRRFGALARELPWQPGQVLMLGDNAEADGRQPQLHGFQSQLLDRAGQHAQYHRWAQMEHSPGPLSQKLDSILGTCHHPFPEFSLTLYTAIERLHGALVRSGARDVLFLAREGQFLKSLFDAYQDARSFSGALRIRTHYFLGSRRAAFLPSLRPLDEEDFGALFLQYPSMTAREFLMNLDLAGLAEDIGRDVPRLDFDRKEADFPHSRAFTTLIGHPRFRAAYAQAVEQSRQALRRYLDSFPLADPDCEEITLMDVGWKGSIQDNLHAALGRPARGFYIGLNTAGRASERNGKQAVLFSFVDGATPHAHIFNETRSLYEVFLAADHGSAKRYRLTGDGHAQVELDDFVESQQFLQRIAPLQRDFRRIFAAIEALLATHRYDATWLLSYTARRHARMVFAPSRREIGWMEDAFHMENFGIYEKSTFRAGTSGKRRTALIARLRFIASIITGRRRDLGFWPWLTIYRQGGRAWAAMYRLYRTHQ